MEEQIAKLRKENKDLKAQVRELKYQVNRAKIHAMLSLDYYLVDRNDGSSFGEYAQLIKASRYTGYFARTYRIAEIDKLLNAGIPFQDITRAVDDAYLEGVAQRTAANEEPDTGSLF